MYLWRLKELIALCARRRTSNHQFRRPTEISQDSSISTGAVRFSSPGLTTYCMRAISFSTTLSIWPHHRPDLKRSLAPFGTSSRNGGYPIKPTKGANLCKIYAESFEHEAHLGAIVNEAREIVNRARFLIRNDMEDPKCTARIFANGGCTMIRPQRAGCNDYLTPESR